MADKRKTFVLGTDDLTTIAEDDILIDPLLVDIVKKVVWVESHVLGNPVLRFGVAFELTLDGKEYFNPQLAYQEFFVDRSNPLNAVSTGTAVCSNDRMNSYRYALFAQVAIAMTDLTFSGNVVDQSKACIPPIEPPTTEKSLLIPR